MCTTRTYSTRPSVSSNGSVPSLGSVATAFASASLCLGAIVDSGPLNLAVPVGTSSPLPRLWIDLDTFAKSTTGSFTGWDISIAGSSATFLTMNSVTLSNNVFLSTGAGTPTPIARLAPSSVIGPGGALAGRGQRRAR